MSGKEERNEINILKAVAEGDENAFRQLFDIYYKPMCVYAMNYIDRFDDAEDIAQNILAQFWIKYSRELFSGSLKGYLFAAVQYDCVRNIKRQKKHINGERLSADTDTDTPALGAVMYEIPDVPLSEDYDEPAYRHLMEEIDKLPEQARRIFIAIVMEDMKYKDVAILLGVSVNTVKTQLSRSLRRLRESLGVLISLLMN